MDLRTIRSWNGSQYRAFEELAFQLFKDEAPTGSSVVRAGNPDGGVEWYATLTDGSEWGWQAKYIFDIDSLLTAMTETVKTLVVQRPKLVHLFVVIPYNLPTARLKNTQKSQRQKFEDKVDFWKSNIHGAKDIEYELIQESDILNQLSRNEHRGRRWFWWQETVFDKAWLDSHFKHQAQVAGKKYRPELDVDLPIAEDLRSLGLSRSAQQKFTTLRRRLVERLPYRGQSDLEDSSCHSADVQWRAAFAELATNVDRTESLSHAVQRLDTWEHLTDECSRKLNDFLDTGFNWRREVEESLPINGSPDRESTERINGALYDARIARDVLWNFQEWIQSTPTKAAQTKAYFLTGNAGTGKTHLLLDAVSEAITEGRPAIFLHGNQLQGDLWTSICDQLGLAHVGRDELLDAMDSAAEASGDPNFRFVISIDALNETSGADYWGRYLPVLHSATSSRPNLALAVSCRTIFLDRIDPASRRNQFTVAEHVGFVGREFEATQKYFDHYGLESPRIPLLSPEFSVPLFLRLYCESLTGSESELDSVGHKSRLQIFELYLEKKIRDVSSRTFPNSTSHFEIQHHRNRVESAIGSIIDRMSLSDSEWLSIDEAKTAVTQTLNGDQELAVRIIGGFEIEGVLQTDPLSLSFESREIGIRVTYQAFCDFLQLTRRIDDAQEDVNCKSFKDWLLHRAHLGILEAAAIVLPERFGVEIPDLLGLKISDADFDRSSDETDFQTHVRVQHVFQFFFDGLIHRAGSSISERTIDLFNNVLQSPVIRTDLYDTLYAIAPQPDNLLNAEGFHRHLARQSMPQRDSTFGFDVYSKIWNEYSPLVRLARWASMGPYPTYPPSIVERSAVPLVWLLSSPNRFMRDWVTKSLVQLLHGHLDVMTKVFERFWDVNDPYVVQRVVSIAYGCLMRAGTRDLKNAASTVQIVLDRVFERPMRADELLLDAACGIVQWGVQFGVVPAEFLRKIERPFGLKIPRSPAKKETLEDKYGIRPETNRPGDESYSTLWFSLFDFSDFGNYVVDSGIGTFSQYRIGTSIPKVRSSESRLIRSRWSRFLKSLTSEQLKYWSGLGVEGSFPSHLLLTIFDDPSSSHRLTEDQQELLRNSWSVRRADVDTGFPSDFARRWIFERTLSLGWSPQLFGVQDRIISHRDHGRSEHKAERWGKKYQWMAYHELLARVADNFQIRRRFDGNPDRYEGLQQLTGERELDPSLPPIDYSDLEASRGNNTMTWRSSPIYFGGSLTRQIHFGKYAGSVGKFLDDTPSYPNAIRLVKVDDQHGEPWLVIDGYESQKEAETLKGHPRLEQLVFVRSAFVHTSSDRQNTRSLIEIWKDDWHSMYSHGHTDCCFAGEVGMSRRPCPSRIETARSIGEGKKSVVVFDATEEYTWEGVLLDCSIGESVFATMPSTFTQSRSHLNITPDGPSWTDKAGKVVATYHRSHASPYHDRFYEGFCVRLEWLSGFLKEQELSLAVLTKFERQLLDGANTRRHQRLESWSCSLIRQDGSLTEPTNPLLVLTPAMET